MSNFTPAVSDEQLQALCEQGSEALFQTEYLEAEAKLAAAEQWAWDRQDWDTLARLYMPLQECRRQRRQRCGEGIVKLDWVSQEPHEGLQAETILESTPAGQLLVGGWGTIEPAAAVRRLAAERRLYVETFLAAVLPTVDDTVKPGASIRVIVIVPTGDTPLPDARLRSPTDLAKALPKHSLILRSHELPAGERRGTPQTYAQVMAIWERLHRPFLQAADAETNPVRRMAAYRQVIQVDYACELAHQKLSDDAKAMSRR